MTSFLTAVALATTFALGLTISGAKAQDSNDSAAMQATIEAQLEAFLRDDWADAYTHASPMIQRLFGDPGKFGQMVRDGYPMVWRPGEVRFLGLETGPDGPRQVVIFTDGNGRAWVADYFMQQVDGVWRINGVTIRPHEEVGA